jgi:hypothetical protein
LENGFVRFWLYRPPVYFYRIAAESRTDGLGNTRRIYANLFGHLLQILHHENNHSRGKVVIILGANARKTFWNLLSWTHSNSINNPRPIFCCEFDSLSSLSGSQFDLRSLDSANDCLGFSHQYLATTLPVKASTSKMTKNLSSDDGKLDDTSTATLVATQQTNIVTGSDTRINSFLGCWCLPVAGLEVAFYR